jgi:flagellar hook-associated protein 1 FlgK
MNISNATTPGYARRTLEVSSTSANFIGGVTANGVVRNNDPAIISARRSAQSDLGYASTVNTFLNRLETTLGTPDDPRALTNVIANLDAKLLQASSRPDAPERLESTVFAAKDLVAVINSTSRDLSVIRNEADASIAAQVTRLNAALEEVEDLNTRIAQINISGLDDSSLLDLRQNVIDEINEIAPVRVAARENGKVALYSTGGTVLLDGSARQIDFTQSNIVTPYMTIEGGQLSGLSINGTSIRTSSDNGGLPGGTLAAQFAVRDELATDAMSQIDAAARDLVERFQDPAVDPTLTPGAAGLFTDGGGPFDPLDEVGLAERLSVNSAVDPAQGGEAWRLRDGIGAAVAGSVGQAAQLNAFRDALSDRRVPASGDFGTSAISLSDLANSLMSRVGVQRLAADQSLSFAASSFFELSQSERAAGVDTDAELQHMILVEQAYAANARMVQTIEEMFDELMRIAR